MHANSNNLLSLIEKDKLLQIIEAFTRATDITIDVNDAEGYPVVQHGFFYGFCEMIRSTEKGLKRCIRSNAEIGLKTAVTGKVCFSTCHAGAVLMAVPIVVNGNYCGSIACGQMHLSPPDENALNEMLVSTGDLGLDRRKLVRSFKEMRVFSTEKCLGASELIQYVINYITELIYQVNLKEETARQKLRSMHEARTRAELENSLRMAELKNLQAQIKPHFLFNTLNTIRGLVTLGKNEKALDTIYALSGLLRYVIDQHGELVTLREELQNINSYLMIQKTRFGEKLSFSIDVEEELYDIQIPFLSLQPIVENACIHGLEPKVESGHLRLKVKKDGHIAIITVLDNGVGIPAEELARIRKTLSMSSLDNDYQGNDSSTSMGLKNVHHRLQLYYGDSYGLSVEAKPGHTQVTMKIPIIRGWIACIKS